MSRILLADDSPHAQRMGERILREEGFEVVTVTDGETALIRLRDTDPDLVMADVFLPEKSGYDICEYIKTHADYAHVRVVLLAGLLEPVDEAKAATVKADAVIKKPFEASAVVATLKPLLEAAQASRKPAKGTKATAPEPVRITGSILGLNVMPLAPKPKVVTPAPPALEPPPPLRPLLRPIPKPAERPLGGKMPEPSEIDAERVRAAVTVALDRAMPAMIDEITQRVLIALGK